MSSNTSKERLQLAQTLCQALTEAGTPVQLRGIRQESYETHYVLSPGSGQNCEKILCQAALIKRTVNQRRTRVQREENDVLVSVIHDFELFLFLNFLVPLCVPSLLVLNLAALDRGLRLVLNTLPDQTTALIFFLAVVVLDICIATIVPGMIRRSRGTADRGKAGH